jgi:galactokinase
VARESTAAFAPGRVNLIGEHTDYNRGLALPMAIEEGITVRAQVHSGGSPHERRIHASALELGEEDEFQIEHPQRAGGWRAFVRGVACELTSTGFALPAADVQISGRLPRGVGLSSSAALEVALCLALLDLAPAGSGSLERREIAQLCSRVESDWVGARTGLLDQLASLYGAAGSAMVIDFLTLEIELVPLTLEGWRLAVLDSGERHVHASSGYNRRRAECERACQLLGVASLRDATAERASDLPHPLDRRVRHVIEENQRVRDTVAALAAGDLPAVGELLTRSHESLRDCFEVCTPGVDAVVAGVLRAGATGARMVGGGFGGSVLALFKPGHPLPAAAREVRPGPGAQLVA